MYLKSTIAFISLAYVGLTIAHGGQVAPPTPRSIGMDADSLEEKPANEAQQPVGEADLNWFPDGLHHDFGRLERGATAEYSFRIVNKSKVPMRIVDLRRT